MHLLITADTLGGVWTYAQELVTGLISHGHRVTLVSFGDIPTAEQTAWMGSLENLDFRPTAFRLEWMQDSDADMNASSEYLLSVIEEVKPDVLHFNQFYYGGLPCDLPKVVVAHSDVVTWWLAVHGKEPPEGSWMQSYRSAVRRAMSGADAIVAPTQWMLNAFEQAHGPVHNGTVIYNGRNPALFNPHLPKKNIAVSVGRLWDLGKNSVLLSRIGSPLPIHLVGSDKDPSGSPDGPLLPSESNALIFEGPLETGRLRDIYASVQIYLATSQYEPFGLAPLEAAFSRCAIVASDIPSLREVWGDSAIYFTNNNALSLQKTLDDLVSDPGRVKIAGNDAYLWAMRHYTSARMTEDYLALYKTLVHKGAVAA